MDVKRWLLWVPLALFAGVLWLAAGQLVDPADRVVRSALVGQPLPDFAVPGMFPGRPGVDGAGFRRGEPRLLNIFASWCVPCIAEAPQLMALKRAGVPIDAIAIRDTPEAVARFLADHGDPYAGIGDDRASSVQLAIGSSGVPETFVIGSDGRIAAQHVGDIRPDDVPRLIAELEKAR